MSEPIREEIAAKKARQRAPREILAGFEPLQTCPKELHHRWEKRVALAHCQPMWAIKLHCRSCVAWHRPEAGRCEIRGCALWALSQSIFGRGS